MLKLQAFKFEIMPNGGQIRLSRQFVGNVRKVKNLALARQQQNYKDGLKYTGAFGMNYWLDEMKSEFSYLKDSPSQTLQQGLADLANAFDKFFKKTADYPTFKKKGTSAESFRYPQGFKIDEQNARIFLPKLGWMRYRNSRNIFGTPKNITVSCVAGKWYASVQTEQEVEHPVHPAISMVGVDVGIAKFATLSDGTVFEPVNSFKQKQRRLTILQRQMSHKVKFSSNWKKAKARVTRLHAKIARIRQDYLHKTTTTLSKSHALVVIEDLQVKNMSASARGTVSKPGRNIRQKSGLNKSILDQGWGEFRRQLEYKQLWAGGEVLAVPAHHTSQTCPMCSHAAKENRTTQSSFYCVRCGYEANADQVGAINILNRGIKVLEGQDTTDASVGCESTARIACEVNGAVKPSATGTRRSDYAGIYA
jgi:IS605 OrfB family transposase